MHEAIKSGSQLYKVQTDSRFGRNEHVVVKGIGPKWITIEGHRGERFDRVTLRSESLRSRLYLSKEVHDAEVLRVDEWQRLRRFVMDRYSPPSEIPTETFQQVLDILNAPKKEQADG